MIIYFLRSTGEIIGTQAGRTHSPEELKMYMGNPSEVDRLIVEWKATKFRKEENGNLTAIEWEVDCPPEMKPLIELFEKDPMLMHREYKMNPANKRFFKKSAEEIKVAKEQEKTQEERKNIRIEQTKQKMILVRNKAAKIEDRFEALLDILDMQAQP